MSQKNFANKKYIGRNKKKFFCCQYKLNWKNAIENSLGKWLFSDPNKALVNILQVSADVSISF